MAKKAARKPAKKSAKKAARSAKTATSTKSAPKSDKRKSMAVKPDNSGPDGSTKELLKKQRGAPPNDQDEKRRLGNYDGAGEPARRGSRTSGIGGQSIRKFKTDKPQTAKSKK